MKRLVVGVLAVAAVAAGIWAAQTWAAQRYRERAADTDQAVLFAERGLARAVAGADKNAIGNWLDRRFTFLDRSGRSISKPQFVLSPEWSASEEDVTVRRYGRIAVVTGSTGAETSPDLFFLHVWLKRRGGWRALTFHDTAPTGRIVAAAARPAACENPCKRVPYQPKSPAEQEIIAAFEAAEAAFADNDADAWVRYVAEEYMIFRSEGRPDTKAEEAASVRTRKNAGLPTAVGEVASMQLWVFGDTAVMTANHGSPGVHQLPYGATRVWVRRDGRWQMALSRHTDIEP
jgi:ketosteroid isomerase-like protein